MKKILILPFFAVMALVSLAWGAEYQACTGDYAGYCKWPESCGQIGIQPGESWSKATCKEAYDNCITNGYFYTDKDCTVWGNKGNNPNFNGGVSIWCQWTTGCQPIKDSTELSNCKTNGSVYKNVTSSHVGDGQTCDGTWTGDGKDPSAVALGCCDWDGKGKCYKVFEDSEWTNCAAQYRYATCPGDEAGTCTGSPLAQSSSSTPSSSSNGGSPIISYNSTPAVGLNLVHFARNLQIASGKDATIFLFDINGKQVLSQRVLSGVTTISLEKQKAGVYYAVAKSGSQKQIVKIVLK